MIFKRYNIEEVTGIKYGLSNRMSEKIDLWNNILGGESPWFEDAPDCGVVDCVIGQLAKPVSEEMEISSENEELAEVLHRLNENSGELVQNLTALGGQVVRPIYSNNKLQYEIERLGNYIPLRYDLDGTLVACVIAKKIQDGKKEYILIEKHDYSNRTHIVKLELYLIVGEVLRRADLSECDVTATLTPSYVWENVDRPMIVEIRNRSPNKVDGSGVPCAIWQNTEHLLEFADRQFARINWEQEGGELRVFADEDLFKKRQGKNSTEKKLSKTLNKLIVKVDGNGTSDEKITEHAPTLRTTDQTNAFNQILRRCELAWNIGKGTLSDLETVQQTATQYTGGKKTLYTMVDSIESELEEKYRHLAYIFAYMLTAYKEIPFDDEISVTYNDTARKDPDILRQNALREVQEGIISKAEYRQRIFGEDEETALAKVPPENVASTVGGGWSL